MYLSWKVKLVGNVTAGVYLDILVLIDIPHITVFLYDRTNKSVSHDIYNGEYSDNRCYDNTKCHDRRVSVT